MARKRNTSGLKTVRYYTVVRAQGQTPNTLKDSELFPLSLLFFIVRLRSLLLVHATSAHSWLVLAKVCLLLETSFARILQNLVPIFFWAVLAFLKCSANCGAEAAKTLLFGSTCLFCLRTAFEPTSTFFLSISHSILRAQPSRAARLSSRPCFLKSVAMVPSYLPLLEQIRCKNPASG